MIRQVALITLRPGAPADRVTDFERAAAGLAQELPCLKKSHLGRHLPGSVGGGDYTWDALVEAGSLQALRRARALMPFLDPSDPGRIVDGIDAVAFTPQHVRIEDPGIREGIKRTLFLRVQQDAPPANVAQFERDTMQMPRYIKSIRNWAFSRTDAGLQPTAWTHVWEQEFEDVDGLEGEYMQHPYHWGLVDGWFDPECPQRIVEPRLAHVYCPAPTTILGWSQDPNIGDESR